MYFLRYIEKKPDLQGGTVRKRLPYCLLCAALLAAAVSAPAAEWNKLIGIGAAVPVNELKFNDITARLYGGAVNAVFLTVNPENRLALKTSLTTGLSATDDISKDDKMNLGAHISFGGGIGYALINQEKQTLTVCAMLNVDYITFRRSFEYSGSGEKADIDQKIKLLVLGTGADITYTRQCNESFGVYVTAACRGIPVGYSHCKLNYKYSGGRKDWEDDWYVLKGTFSIVPSLGIYWYFK